MPKAFKPLAIAAARSIDDRKAEKIVVLDVRKTSPLSDFMIIATALSRPHLEALEDKVSEDMERLGMKIHRRNKPQTDVWRVLDYGGLIVHLMSEDARALYSLEKLHVGAKEVAWRS